MMWTGISGALGILAGFWVMAFLFHLVPLPAKDTFEAWWSFPWAFTAVGTCGGVVAIAVRIGAILDDRKR